MTRAVFEFSGTLTALSPLHAGTGGFRKLTHAVTGKDGANEPPEVLAIARDARGLPYLPGTTIKGLVRRLVERQFAADEAARQELLGVIKSDGKGRMGAMLARGATMMGDPPDASAMPFADKVSNPQDEGLLGAGVFIAARTSIDRASGTAAEGRLFHMEMAAPGARFKICLIVETRGELALERASSLAAKLAAALHLLTGEQGVNAGKGQADGFGALRLDAGSVKVLRRSLSADGSMARKDAADIWQKRTRVSAAPAKHRAPLVLVCDGPFLVIDSSVKSKKGQRAEDDESAQINPQRLKAELPLLMGTSVSGVLRNRARWLEGVKQLRAGAAVSGIDPHDAIIAGRSEVNSLTAVQRLFGVTGFRGLLTIKKLEVVSAKPWEVTSVKLDRFSGAPADNALFKTAAFIGARIKLELELEERPGLSFGDDAHVQLFEDLAEDIRKHGLRLGHGGNKGFGWFKAEGGRP